MTRPNAMSLYHSRKIKRESDVVFLEPARLYKKYAATDFFFISEIWLIGDDHIRLKCDKA